MNHVKWGDLEAVKFDRRGDRNGLRANVVARHFIRRISPGEQALNFGERFRSAIKRELFFAVKTKGAQFVKAENVIEMRVREKNAVKLAHSFAQSLLAQVGAGVDEEISGGRFEKSGRASALVFWVRRRANLTTTTNDGNPDRSRGA